MAFDPIQSKIDLLCAISELDPWKLATAARHDELHGRAEYIAALGKLVANHIEYLAAEADASIFNTCIDETSAQSITDITSDLAGSIKLAADRMMETA